MAGRPERQAQSLGHFYRCRIQACLTLKALFGPPLRQTIGLIASLLEMAGLNWPVPDFSTLSRRQKGLDVAIPYRLSGARRSIRQSHANRAASPSGQVSYRLD